MMQPVLGWVVEALAIVVALFIGYFRGYLTQKGQNLATHEDIEKLVDQVRAVTMATKQIEAKISDEVWDRQKRWELKRDLLIDVLKKAASLREGLFRLYTATLESKNHNHSEKTNGVEPQAASAKLDAAIAEYDQSRLVVDLVCGKRVKGALLYYESYINDLARTIVEGCAEKSYAELTKELMDKQHAILFAVRAEMGSDPLFSDPEQ